MRMEKTVLGNVVLRSVRDFLGLCGRTWVRLDNGIDLMRMFGPLAFEIPRGRFFINDFQRPFREGRAGKNETKEC